MPTYVYACDACGKQFEKFQSFKEDPLTTCAICEQSGKVRRVFQPVGVVFKGSGWYINDSRKGESSASSSETPKADTKAETKTDAASETKTETKTETKAETSATSSTSSGTTTSGPAPSAAS